MHGNRLMYVALKALIEKDGEVLVLKDPNLPADGLDYPGGKISEDEFDIETPLRREVKEECGLEIEIGRPVYAWMHQFKDRGGKQYKVREVFIVAYACKYKSGEVKLSEEHNDYFWVNKSNYKRLDTGGNYFKALDTYFKNHHKK
ncbi:MAG: NUDIX domain-containing protein [bacterium]|nr:NUDIX domain-containing protein [bacterium]